MLALEFPPINEVIRWRDLFPTFNKIALIAVLAALITVVLLFVASRRDPLKAPRGVRNLVEAVVDFIEGIVMQTIGRDGLGWTPFLLSLFMFIYLCNLPGIIPRSSTCRPRRAWPSRCSSPSSCGSSTTASASSIKASSAT